MNAEQDRNLTTDKVADGTVEQGQLAKLVLEAGPLVVFFIANARWGIFPATGAFMVATILALTVSRIKFGRIPIMPLVSRIFRFDLWRIDALFPRRVFHQNKTNDSQYIIQHNTIWWPFGWPLIAPLFIRRSL